MSQTSSPTLNRKNKIIDDEEEGVVSFNGVTTDIPQQSSNRKKEEKKLVKTYEDGSESESEMDTDSESYDTSDSSSSSGEDEDDGYLWNINEENGKDVAIRGYEHRGENKNPTTAVLMQTKKSKKINFPISVKDNKCSVGVSGYCMIKASHCLESGSYYYEVKIDDSVQCDLSKLPDYARQSHYRCGWSLKQGFDKACCGYDKYSFSYGSREGNCFHKAKGTKYGENFGVGDVIGCYIEIPEVSMPHIVYIDGSMSLKTGEVFRTKIATLAEKSVPGSKVIFFKNGKFQGVAFSDIPYGAYFPAISLYMNASVTMRFEKNQLEYNPYDICPEYISPNWKPIGDLRYRNKNTQKTPKKTSSQNEFKTPPSISKNNLKEIGKGASKQLHQSPSQNRHSKIASASISENKKPKEKKEKSHHHHSSHGDKKITKKKKQPKTSSNTIDAKQPVTDGSTKAPPVGVFSTSVELPPTVTVTETPKLEKPEKKKKPKPLKVITDVLIKESKPPSKSHDSPRLPPTPSLNQNSDSPLVRSSGLSSMPRVSSSSDIMPPSPVLPQSSKTEKSTTSDKSTPSPSSTGSATMKQSSSTNSFEKSDTPTISTTGSSTNSTLSTPTGNASSTNPPIHPPITATLVNDAIPVNKPFITNMSDKPIVQSSFPSIEKITPQTKERKSKSKSEGSSIMARSKNFTPKKVLITKKEDLVNPKTAPKRKAPSKDEEPVVHHHTVKLLDPKDIQAKKPKPTPPHESTPTSSNISMEKETKPSSPTKKRKTSKAESKEAKDISLTGYPKSKEESKKIESSEAQHAAKETYPERIIETIVPNHSQPTLSNPIQQSMQQASQPMQDTTRNTLQTPQHYSLQHSNQPTSQSMQAQPQQSAPQYERSNPEPAYSFSSLLLGTNNTPKSMQEQMSPSSTNLTQQSSQLGNYYNTAQLSNNERKQDWTFHQLQANNNAPTTLSNNMSSVRNVQDMSPNFQSRMTLENMLSQKQENTRLLEQINLPKETHKQSNPIQSTHPTNSTPSFRELLDSPSTFLPPSNNSQNPNTNNNLLSAHSRNIPSVISQLTKVGNPNITNYQMSNKDQNQVSMNSGNYTTYGHQQQAVNEVKQLNQHQISNQNNFNQYSQRGNNFSTNTSSYTPSVNINSSSLNFSPHQNASMNTANMGVTNNMTNSLASSMSSLNQLSNSMSSKYNTMQSSQNYSNINQTPQQINTSSIGNLANMGQPPKQMSNQNAFNQPMLSNPQQYSANNIPRGFAPQQMNPQQLGNNMTNSHQQQLLNASNIQQQQQLPGMHHQQNPLLNSVNNNFAPNQHYQQQLHHPQSTQQSGQSSFKYNYLNQ